MSWGIELWDQFDNLIKYTERGAAFCETAERFMRDRCLIEEEYAKNLRKLAKSMLPKKRENEDYYQCLTFSKAFARLLKEQQDIAGQHELIAENIREKVISEIQELTRFTREQKRKTLEDYLKNKRNLERSVDCMSKACKKYEEAYEIGRKAGDLYQKANEDINLSRAQVEKARINMGEKNNICENTRREYLMQVKMYNDNKRSFFENHIPQIFKELQNFDENRINRIQSCFNEFVSCHREVIPRIMSCLNEMTNSCNAISFEEDSNKIIDCFKSGYAYPCDEVPLDLSVSDTPHSSSNDSFSKLNGTMRKSKGGTIKKMRGIFHSKKNGSCQDVPYAELPPAQRLKRYQERRRSLLKELATKQKEREGLLKMRIIYKENPKFGEENKVDEKLMQTDETISSLQKEIKKYEQFIDEVIEKSNGEVNGNKGFGSEMSLEKNSLHSDPGTPISCQSNETNESSLSFIPSGSSKLVLPNASTPNVLSDKNCELQFDHCDNPSVISDQTNADGRSITANHDIESEDYSVPIGKAIANYDFASDDFYEAAVSFEVGEEMIVIEKDTGDGWTRVRKTDGQSGFVPTSYCEIVLFSGMNK